MVDSSIVPRGSMAQKIGEHPYLAIVGPELIRHSYLVFSTIGRTADYYANLKLAEANVMFKDLTKPGMDPANRAELEKAFNDKINYGRNIAHFTGNYETASKFDQVLLSIQRNEMGEITNYSDEERKKIEDDEFKNVLRNELQKIKLDNKVMEEIGKEHDILLSPQSEMDDLEKRFRSFYFTAETDDTKLENYKKINNIIETALQNGVSLETAFRSYEKMKQSGELENRSQKIIERAFFSAKINAIEKKYNNVLEKKGGYDDIKAVEKEIEDIDLGYWGFNTSPAQYQQKKKLELKIKTQLRALKV